MRFAYIDSQGKEVGIPTVDALRLRIALKAIVEDTVFYDGSTERWAPAREHELYRALRRELTAEDEARFPAAAPGGEGTVPVEVVDADLELEVEPPEAEASPDLGDGEEPEWRFAISNAPTDRGEPAGGGRPARPSAPSEDVEVDEGLGDLEPPPETPDLPGRGPGEESDPRAETGRLGSSSWIDLDMEGEEVFELDESSLVERPRQERPDGPLELVPEMGGPATAPPSAGPPPAAGERDGISTVEGFSQDRFDFEGLVEEAGWGDEPPPRDMVVESTAIDPEAPAPPPVAPTAGPSRPADDLPVPSREELMRRADAPRPGAPGRPRPPAGRAARSGRGSRGGVLVGVIAVLAVGVGGAGWWFLGRSEGATGDPDDLAASSSPVVVPEISAELRPRMEELAAEVRTATLESLRTFHQGQDVPEEPPARWLAGDYLANASRFGDVEAYWTSMERFLRTMQAAEDSIFAATLDRRMGAGEPAETRPVLEERILAGFRAGARERGAVYIEARSVAQAALRLHGFLIENEPGIVYQPGVSSDPVLEAVPTTAALGEEMWDRVGDITEAMDALGFLDKVTTPRLVNALVDRLAGVPLR
jgi:hypothetical protein